MTEPVRKKSKDAAVYSTNFDEGWERLYPVGPGNRNKNELFYIHMCTRVLEMSSSMLEERHTNEW